MNYIVDNGGDLWDQEGQGVEEMYRDGSESWDMETHKIIKPVVDLSKYNTLFSQEYSCARSIAPKLTVLTWKYKVKYFKT